MADSRSYTAGHFGLTIDGQTSTAYLKSIEGGFVSGSIIEEPIGSDNKRVKHMGPVDIDPFSVEFSLSNSKDVLSWIAASWKHDYHRCHGQITHADFNLNSTFEHQFTEALILETTFPTLDGSSKEAAYLKLKIQPEGVKTNTTSGTLSANIGPPHQTWLPSAFRFTLNGVDGMEYTNKIESFTIKQGIKKFYTGESRYPQIEPTKIEFPNIVGSMSLKYASGLLAWHQKYVVEGQQDSKAQTSGSIEFLTPDRKRTLFTVQLKEVGILKAAIDKSTAGEEKIKRVNFELFVGEMALLQG